MATGSSTSGRGSVASLCVAIAAVAIFSSIGGTLNAQVPSITPFGGLSSSATPGPTVTLPPSAVPTAQSGVSGTMTTPAASPRALTTTGTITDVIGWAGLAVLLCGVTFLLIAGPRKRHA